MSDAWAADTPVSLPEPIDSADRRVPMYGFVFTENGLFHDINEADHEVLRVPSFGPPTDPHEVVYDDE